MSPPTKHPTLVELKHGGPRYFFLVHSGDGDVQLYSSLARRMPDDFAVFGIEPYSIPGVPIAHTRIEDMAAHYVKEVRKMQPRGPYLLGGHCAGGIIAYEMASQLLRVGEALELLVLLEAATPQAPARRLRLTKNRFGNLTKKLADARKRGLSILGQGRLLVGGVLRESVNSVRSKAGHLGDEWWGRARPPPASRARATASMASIHSRAQLNSDLQCRRSPLRAEAATQCIRRARTGGWGSIIQDLAIVDVDGGPKQPCCESLLLRA